MTRKQVTRNLSSFASHRQLQGGSDAAPRRVPASEYISSSYFSDVLARSYDECYAMGEGSATTWPLVLFIIVLGGLCLSTAVSQSECTTQTAPRHRKHGSYRTMRIFTGLLLVSGAAGLQLPKNIKLAAPALPVAALLPSAAIAAADSYEYGSA